MADIQEERRPLAPQFTLRWLLGLTTVCAFLFAVFGMAARGRGWAIGISAALGSVALMAMVYALLFACAWVAAMIVRRPAAAEGDSPFRALPADTEVPLDAEIVP